MAIKVFIQNEAGSNRKHYHDEKTLVWKRSVEVSRPYPFPYGFIVGTTAADGCNVDCFVITQQPLKTGDALECEVVGLMEQIEDGHEDHNVLAVPFGKVVSIRPEIQTILTDFVSHVFDHMKGKVITVGPFLGSKDAEDYIARHRDHA